MKTSASTTAVRLGRRPPDARERRAGGEVGGPAVDAGVCAGVGSGSRTAAGAAAATGAAFDVRPRKRVFFVSWGDSSRAAASSRASSPAEAGRSPGSRAIPRWSTRAARFGAFGHASRSSGGPSVAILCAISIGLRPSRGFFPLSASNAIAASA
jgi:hypothetical protein